jgi:hypothetical protein
VRAIGGVLLIGVPAVAWIGSIGLAAKYGVSWLLVVQAAATLIAAYWAASRMN